MVSCCMASSWLFHTLCKNGLSRSAMKVIKDIIVLTKQLLRSRVWFPGVDKLVEREVKSCLPCQVTTSVTTRAPLVMPELPSEPWECVAIDFCGPFPAGELALVVVARYPELEIVMSTSMSAVRPKLEKIFAIHGIPDLVKLDSGPPFDSDAFEDYAKEKNLSISL